MMTGLDRTKWMSEAEVRLLRTVAQAGAIMDLAKGRVKGPVTWAVVDVALTTGLRVSEIARLTVGDLDAKRQTLRITRSKRKHPKPESLEIGPRLTKHLQDFIAWKKDVGQPTGKSDGLFTGKRGDLSKAGLAQLWRKVVALAGLPSNLGIHSARHTFAVHALKRTGNLRAVQKQLGHTSPTTTANLYADVTAEDMAAMVTDLYGSQEEEQAKAQAEAAYQRFGDRITGDGSGIRVIPPE